MIKSKLHETMEKEKKNRFTNINRRDELKMYTRPPAPKSFTRTNRVLSFPPPTNQVCCIRFNEIFYACTREYIIIYVHKRYIFYFIMSSFILCARLLRDRCARARITDDTARMINTRKIDNRPARCRRAK